MELNELRKVAEAATPGEWVQWNPSVGESHIAIANKVAWRSLKSSTKFADDEKIPHWADATHIATFDPPTVLALITELETFRRRLDAMRRQRDGYRNQLRKTEQQVARVRELREGQLCGHCADEVQDALEGELE